MAILDATILGAICVTWALKLLTVLLLEGGIPSSVWSLPANMSLHWEDDFRTVLLKLLIVSSTSTSISGFANEMPELNSNEVATQDLSSVEILPDGKVLVNGGRSRGLREEIKKVKARPAQTSDAIFGGLMESKRLDLVARVGRSYWHILRSASRQLWSRIPLRSIIWRRSLPSISTVTTPPKSKEVPLPEVEHVVSYKRLVVYTC